VLQRKGHILVKPGWKWQPPPFQGMYEPLQPGSPALLSPCTATTVVLCPELKTHKYPTPIYIHSDIGSVSKQGMMVEMKGKAKRRKNKPFFRGHEKVRLQIISVFQNALLILIFF